LSGAILSRVGAHPAVRELEGEGLLAVPGLRAGSAAAGIKPGDTSLDVGLLVADAPRPAAAVFTANEVVAAPVTVCRERLAARPEVRTVVINSGNANALTGARSRPDAEAMIARAEERCGGPALVLSTGVIGVPLPLERALAGIDAAADALGASPDHGGGLARAMLTTDTRTKQCAVEVELAPGQRVRVGGVAKGSGMVHPRMATMLAVLATDAPAAPAALDAALRGGVDVSFHRITVDGDTSTNDAVVLLGGDADVPPLDAGDPRLEPFTAAVAHVARRLALEIVRDGEGVTRTVEVRVGGAPDGDAALRVGMAIARSPLVKTAIAGGDANWGRILAAAGTVGAGVDPERAVLRLGGVTVFERGEPLPEAGAAADARFAEDHVEIDLDLGLGPAAETVYTTDLSHGYVDINADYRT